MRLTHRIQGRIIAFQLRRASVFIRQIQPYNVGFAAMPDVFISYSRRDNRPVPPHNEGFVSRLCSALEARGLDVWMDKRDITPANDFQKDIDDGIRQSHFFLMVISPDMVASPYCAKETALAMETNKRLIPVMRCEADARTGQAVVVPPEFAPLDWIFARETDDFAAAVNRIDQVLHSGDQA